MKKINYLLFASFMAASCNNRTVPAEEKAHRNDEQQAMALLYQQKAAEYRALCLQAYNIARYRVDLAVRQHKPSSKPMAIVTDLDETALDNSASAAWLYLHDSTANNDFIRSICARGVADSLPGSVSFFNYARSKGIDIYYISNRDASDSVITGTMRNMRSLGFPYTSESDRGHYLFQSGPASKEPRRQMVAQTHEIILRLGDNLIDLDSSFDGKSMEQRQVETERLRNMWGDRYIVFPNACYGDWEMALYATYKASHPGTKMNIQTKDSIRVSYMQSLK